MTDKKLLRLLDQNPEEGMGQLLAEERSFPLRTASCSL